MGASFILNHLGNGFGATHRAKFCLVLMPSLDDNLGLALVAPEFHEPVLTALVLDTHVHFL
jgi:hypothetical protein